jgi:hypothetical protein
LRTHNSLFDLFQPELSWKISWIIRATSYPAQRDWISWRLLSADWQEMKSSAEQPPICRSPVDVKRFCPRRRADRRGLRFPFASSTSTPNDRGRFVGPSYDRWGDRTAGTGDELPSPYLMENLYDPLVALTVPYSYTRRDVMYKSSPALCRPEDICTRMGTTIRELFKAASGNYFPPHKNV